MVKVIDESGQIHWVFEGALQRSPVSEPSPGTDLDRTISLLAAKRGKKPEYKPQYRPKYKKPAYKPKKKPAKKKK